MQAGCPQCRYTSKISEKDIGHKARCPRCKTSFILEALAEPSLAPRDLDCPRCGGGPLSAPLRELRELECENCYGALLTAASVDRLAGECLNLTPEQLHSLQTFVPQKPLACPCCGEGMALLTLRGVPLDYCPGCIAVWFDDGELSRVSSERYGIPKVLHTRPPKRSEPVIDQVPAVFRYGGWILPRYCFRMVDRKLIATNSWLARVLTLFCFLRKIVIDPERRVVQIKNRWLLLFAQTLEIPFSEISELTTDTSEFMTGVGTMTHSYLMCYSVILKARDQSAPVVLATFWGTRTELSWSFTWRDASPFPDLLPVHKAYYAFYDYVTRLLR